MQITGVELLIKVLVSEGVDKLFAYPGGQVIPTFDGLYKQNDIEVILPRHEQALVHAADGYARATGKVGVCLVTSGPGATNAVTGIANANYDSVPLVCLTGQVATKIIGNDAFQEVDIVGITRSITKHSIVVTNRADLGQILKEAFYIATTGKPGPVVVDLPIDIMRELGSDHFPKVIGMRSYKPNFNVHMGQLKKAVSALMEAKKPVFLVGGGVNLAKANEEFTQLVEKTRVPVISTIMGKGAIATTHELYIGPLGMHGSFAANNAIMDCDVLFSIGTRFNDRIAGNIEQFAPNATVIHIDIDPSSISRNIAVDIPIVGDAKKAINAMLNYVDEVSTKEWIDTIKDWKNNYPFKINNREGVSPQKVFDLINTLPSSIIVTDVGQHQMWAVQHIEIDKDKCFITSGGLGTMGFGLPAAIGAQIGKPDKKVVCISGDGGFQMNSQELATAVSCGLPIITFIFNNSYLGMVRQWQDLFYGKRYSSTCLRKSAKCADGCVKNISGCPAPYTPDFVKLAESYGAKGIRVSEDSELEDAFNEALSSTYVPVVIEVIIEEELNVMPMVAPGSPLNEIIMEG